MQLKRWDTKEVIFELECKSWEELLKGALKAKISFFKANFRGANFRGADFRSADFRLSNFSSADFSSADFRGADFSSADFRSVNFSGADFRWADFSDSKHQNKIGNMREWHSMQLETYQIGFNSKILCIGCEQHTIREWDKFTDKRILEMDGKSALKFWRKWKKFIFNSIELCYGGKK